MKPIKKALFKFLARVNKFILPKYSNKNLDHLSKIDKAVIAYRYYITKNAIND